MANRIPRNASKLHVTFLTNTSAGKSGLTMTAEKTERGWIGNDGKREWHLFPEHLRNENLCKIKVIA